MKQTQALVVGAGPGGYVCAFKLAQLGRKVVLVEKDKLGGVCLNVGCIPSKALIHAAGLAHKLRKSEPIGFAPAQAPDWAKAVQWKGAVVGGLTRGIGGLAKAHGVEVLSGTARFTGPGEAQVGEETVRFETAFILTGSSPAALPGFEFDGKNILSSTEALDLPAPPASLAVIGGGVIGLELGTVFAKLGTKVSVVESLDALLPGVEPDLAAPVARSLQRLGAEIHLKSKALHWAPKDGLLELTLETPEGEKTVSAERILLSVGRKPNTAGLGLEAAGVKTDARGFIVVDAAYRTSAPNLYAAGDVIGPPYLAHKASREAVLAARASVGKPAEAPGFIPSAVYTDPEIASVGETEAQAKARGVEVLVGRFPFSANGRAQTMRDAEGFVKVVGNKADGRLLGAGIVGPDASDLIGEAALALRMKATLHDLAETVHPHPTLSEALMEAAEAALGECVHLPPPRR